MAQRVVIPGFRKIEKVGGGEGTTNYEDLTNKPSINNVPLIGNLNTVNLKLTDPTLTEEGVPAEAKTVGDKLEEHSTSLTALSEQLGNHTVKSDVPENAVFTDTVYDDTEVKEDVDTLKKETTVNLLNPTLQTTTSNDVTCTNNGDGTYILNGTNSSSSSNITFILNLNYSDFPTSKVKLVGCPDLAESGKAILQTFYNESWAISSLWDTGNGVILENGQKLTKLAILVYPGKNVDGMVFKPMLTTNLDATYDDFVPYTGDTGRLNGDVAKLKNDLDKLDSLPIGSIIQIEKAKDDIETTKQKYGWQYLGTSNIQSDNGSESLLVTNVYRKNN